MLFQPNRYCDRTVVEAINTLAHNSPFTKYHRTQPQANFTASIAVYRQDSNIDHFINSNC